MTIRFKNLLANMWHSAYLQNEKNILTFLTPQPGATLIDLGCDNGQWSNQLAEKIQTKNIYGVDIIEERLTLAEQKGIKTYSADLNNHLPFADNYFDIVHANQVIEHISNLDLFISEIYRILKKGGCVILSTENASSWCNIFASIMGWQIFSLTNITRKKSGLGNPLALHRNSLNNREYASWAHKTIFNYQGLIDFLKAYDFNINKIKGAGYFPLSNFFSEIDKRHSHFLSIKAYK
ncbi:MAG: class I SAM-dependent methyltransferase [Candidatus Parcubacteria bacterium]|nr:class I SAM-dependent methyltransferase [Candidatus Parcubacteria bacterium]